jgi:hypothetical protein
MIAVAEGEDLARPAQHVQFFCVRAELTVITVATRQTADFMGSVFVPRTWLYCARTVVSWWKPGTHLSTMAA